MPTHPRHLVDYFRYTPGTPEAEAWGLYVTAAGFTRVAAGTPYPPGGHPADHSFLWENGRVLGTFQVVFILEGTGIFESKAHGRSEIRAGCIFLLFPQQWHRYAPSPDTGWVESWVEFDGEIIRRLLRTRVLHPGQPVHLVRQLARMDDHLEQIHARLRFSTLGFDPEIGAATLAILAQICAEQRAGTGGPSLIDQIVVKAQTILAAPPYASFSIPELAQRLGVGYSHFRREFKRRTGLSPKQYHERVRLDSGRRLLGGSPLTLGEIANRLGYASAFNFSAAFKREFGLSPMNWRRKAQSPDLRRNS